MTAIIARLPLSGPPGPPRDDTWWRTLMATMAHRGQEHFGLERVDHAMLAATWDSWEEEVSLGGMPAILSASDVTVIADASLYYQEDLRRAIASRHTPRSASGTAALVLDAYLAFGDACVHELEGDFAFVLWDAARGRLLAGRDMFGMRSLFYAVIDGALIVASTTHPLVKMQGAAAGFDREGVLRALMMRPGAGQRTAWRDIQELPAGASLVVESGKVREVTAPPLRGREDWRALSHEDAVQATASILDAAVAERIGDQPSALAMSGGMDSTALMACATATGRKPQILSFRFPEGDPGDEMWYIRAVAEFLDAPIRWVETEGIPLFENFSEFAKVRSNCHGQSFEGFNRRLAREGITHQERVALNGHGGDSLFGVGPVLMADLFRRGRWMSLRSHMRARGIRKFPILLEHIIRPALPLGLFDALEPLLGRTLCSRPYERPIPAWLTPPPDLLSSVIRIDRKNHDQQFVRPYQRLLDRFRVWGLVSSSFTRANSALYDMFRDEHVELRLPFYDRRLAEFVLSRPGEEFNRPGQPKALLADAMRQRLPDRRREAQRGGMKPGTAIGFLERGFRPAINKLLESLEGTPWVLEEMGLIDRARFLADWRETNDVVQGAVDVSLLVVTERWLRSQ